MTSAWQGFKKIFRDIRYAALALGVALGSYFLLVVSPQYGIIGFFWSLPVGFARKLYFVYSIALGFLTGTGFLSVVYVLGVSALLGLNVAAFIYFYRTVHEGWSGTSIAPGLGGGFLAFLGAGCASCGTFIATYVLGLIGGQGLLLWLPLGGVEFAIVGIAGLLVSLYLICRRV